MSLPVDRPILMPPVRGSLYRVSILVSSCNFSKTSLPKLSLQTSLLTLLGGTLNSILKIVSRGNFRLFDVKASQLYFHNAIMRQFFRLGLSRTSPDRMCKIRNKDNQTLKRGQVEQTVH